MSASAPAGSANSSIGTVAATCTSATRAAEFGVSTRIHCAPTVCIQVPSMLPSWANQRMRKALMRNGDQADGVGALPARSVDAVTGFLRCRTG